MNYSKFWIIVIDEDHTALGNIPESIENSPSAVPVSVEGLPGTTPSPRSNVFKRPEVGEKRNRYSTPTILGVKAKN